jgi:hypothetical protein
VLQFLVKNALTQNGVKARHGGRELRKRTSGLNTNRQAESDFVASLDSVQDNGKLRCAAQSKLGLDEADKGEPSIKLYPVALMTLTSRFRVFTDIL